MSGQQAAAETNHPPVTAYNPPPALDAAMSEIPLVQTSKKPTRVGYLTNYSFHIWYQIVIEILQRRGQQYGVEIEVVDAGLSVENQVAQARQSWECSALILTPEEHGLRRILRIAF